MTDEEAIEAAKAAQSPNLNSSASVIPKEAHEWLRSLNLEGISELPATQVSMTLLRDPAFRGAVSEIYQKFDKTSFFGYEMGWILLVWIVRAWRLSKAGTWLTRLWVQAWVAVVFWLGSLLVVPWLLWGKSYQMALATVFRAVIHQFWA